jgi:hypothetical protein
VKMCPASVLSKNWLSDCHSLLKDLKDILTSLSNVTDLGAISYERSPYGAA